VHHNLFQPKATLYSNIDNHEATVISEVELAECYFVNNKI